MVKEVQSSKRSLLVEWVILQHSQTDNSLEINHIISFPDESGIKIAVQQENIPSLTGLPVHGVVPIQSDKFIYIPFNSSTKTNKNPN